MLFTLKIECYNLYLLLCQSLKYSCGLMREIYCFFMDLLDLQVIRCCPFINGNDHLVMFEKKKFWFSVNGEVRVF